MANLQTLYRLKVQTLLEKLAFGVEHKIKERTSAGSNVHGEAFKDYSPGYAKKRIAHGLQLNPVNLMYTGDMLAQITHEVPSFDPNSMEIFFRTKRAEDLAYFHNITGAGRSRVFREFFDLNEGDINDLFILAEDTMHELAEEITEEVLVKMIKSVRPR